MNGSAGQVGSDLAGVARRSTERTAYRLELAEPDGDHQVRQGHATPAELAVIFAELAAHYAARVDCWRGPLSHPSTTKGPPALPAPPRPGDPR